MRAPAASRQGFVGRVQDLATLRDALQEAATGRGLVALVGGEPGIGKTRLAEEMAEAATASGAQVLWASCSPRGPAFWCWSQLLRQLMRTRDELREVGNDLAMLLPERIGLAQPECAGAPEHAQFQVFDAVASVLREASTARPLLAVLDDLHWADPDSLQLLSFVAREMRGMAVLVLGTFRDVEVDDDHALSVVLNELTSQHRRLALAGLESADVAELLTGLTHASLSPQLLDAVQRQTGGNPLFVREAVRLLDGRGELGPAGLRHIPHGVRTVIDRRLRALTPGCVELLEAAALIGDEFDEDLLTTATGVDTSAVRERLAEAAAARLVEVPAGHDRHRFVHALVREVLETRAGPERRREGHRRVGEALETCANAEMQASTLAHHFAAAGVTDKARDYATAAGHRAYAGLAYEDAAEHFNRALTLPEVPASQRCELLLALGRARKTAGHITAAKADLHRAGTLARQLGAHTVLAEAALAYATGPSAVLPDEHGVALLSDALDAVGEQDSPVRARLLGTLAHALALTAELDRRRDLATRAESMARRLGDPLTLAGVLHDRHVAAQDGPNARERLALATEATRLAQANGDDLLAQHGRALRAGDLLELGDIEGFEREVDIYEREVTAQRLPRLRCAALMLRSSQAGIAGRFTDAERLATESRQLGEQLGADEMTISYTLIQTAHRLSSGALGDAVEEWRELAVRYPTLSFCRSVVTAALCAAGRLDEARTEFDKLAAGGFTELPRGPTWQPMAMLLALSCVVLGDRSGAAALYELAAPYARRHTQFGVYGFGYIGPVSYYLGLLAGTLDRWDEALDHLQDAITDATQLGAPPFVAHAQYQHARALRARGCTGDAAQAGTEHESAVTAADRLGIRFHHCRDVLEPASPATGAVLRPDGDYWTVRYTGPSFRAAHTVGLGYLARLLTEPHREWHVTDLAGVADRGDAGPVLDGRAKTAYRERLSELAAELREAEDWADTERATRCRLEIDQLTEQLTHAVGLGGRDRRAASETERARVRVTKAIKASIRNLARHDPALGEHLTRTVRTGTYCVYTGERTWMPQP